jgi:signal transduction histidine kinase
VFERFSRANDAEFSTYPGMGLGLYIAAGIIHRHGGKMQVSSVLGSGSVFTFSIPLPEDN